MRHEKIYQQLLGVFNPLSLKLLLLLCEKPHKKMELYEECKNWNNATVKQQLDQFVTDGLLQDNPGRGRPYILTIKGRQLTDWLQEGGLLHS